MAPSALTAAQNAPRGEYGEITPLPGLRDSVTAVPSPLSRTVKEKVNPRDRVTVRLYDRSTGASTTLGAGTRTPAVTGDTTGFADAVATGVSVGAGVGSGVGVDVVAVVVAPPLALVM